MQSAVKSDFEGKKAVLVLMKGSLYNDEAVAIVRSLAKKQVCYVTLNKPFDVLIDIFERSGVNSRNIFFIDAITRTLRPTGESEGAACFASSPGALTEISVLVGKSLKNGYDYLVFDSLTSLVMHNEKSPVGRFATSIVNQARQANTSIALFMLDLPEHRALIEECEMLVDKVVRL